MTDDELDAAIMAAHAAGDTEALARLYHEGGARVLARGDVDHACFLLVAAYVYALEAGMPLASEIHAILKAHGREA